MLTVAPESNQEDKYATYHSSEIINYKYFHTIQSVAIYRPIVVLRRLEDRATGSRMRLKNH